MIENTSPQRTRQGLFIGATAAAVLLVWLGPRLVPESSPVARGATHAYMQGCIECHGQPANRRRGDTAFDCAADRIRPTHRPYEGECRDLLAYFEVIRLKRTFATRARTQKPNRVLQGESLARKYSCFQCHGELGQGGFRNSGALKGYVPGYFGKDFALLTRGGRAESVRAWIKQGIDPALFERPIEGTIASFFVNHQAISMPNFGTLPDSEIRLLTNYVIILNRFGAMDAQKLRAYNRLTQRP